MVPGSFKIIIENPIKAKAYAVIRINFSHEMKIALLKGKELISTEPKRERKWDLLEGTVSFVLPSTQSSIGNVNEDGSGSAVQEWGSIPYLMIFAAKVKSTLVLMMRLHKLNWCNSIILAAKLYRGLVIYPNHNSPWTRPNPILRHMNWVRFQNGIF